ncbi:hypothetical protein ACQ33O_05570 [Ferruginibacter sp. SUN002]|uniref:hypothetical protein n=1 Tax=Ferruginibacter sp. SUN002 TaxID=2937789 RepID=UPI003D35ECD3
MSEQQESLKDLQHIKQMMERSSRFISLSGWSGIAAGITALIAAFVAKDQIDHWLPMFQDPYRTDWGELERNLIMIAATTFIVAFVSAFFFTYYRSRKHGVAIWGAASRRLLFAVAVPLVAGGLFLLKEIEFGNYALIAPGCLIFYGLALVNASKYTLGEVKYLGYSQLILGVINCWMVGYGLYFWAIGFGVLHIVYGAIMWNRYERTVD